jgi:protein arginine N-methyltransferase 2
MGDDDTNTTPNARLLDAAAKGDLELVERLIGDGEPEEANPDCARPEDGATPLMLAAEGGHAAVVAALLQAGAAYNLLDHGGHCAGEYSGSAHPEVTQMLMQWGVEMEELLIARDEEEQEEEAEEGGDEAGPSSENGKRPRLSALEEEEERESREYLSQRLVYDDTFPSGPRLLDANGDAVMMGWEAPLMRRHADALCGTEGSGSGGINAVLNVGFGLGIVDRDLQRHSPKRHVIVEAHPDVLARIDAEGWGEKPGVTVLRGRWEDVLKAEEPAIADIMAAGGFDAIYWDTYAQHARQLRRFHADVLPRLLRRPCRRRRGGDGGGGGADGREDDEGGRYSWFNGVGSDNSYFHAVSTHVIARHLARQGFGTSFEKLSVAELGDEVWSGVARAYWKLPFYLMPTVRWEREETAGEDEE